MNSAKLASAGYNLAMKQNLAAFLKHKALNDWNLFLLVMTPTSILIGMQMASVDLSVPEDVKSMIRVSVLFSVPWLYLAFATSSIQKLFPGVISRYLVRNRRSIGLCFSGGMAWQLLFILWLIIGHTDDYLGNPNSIPNLMTQIPGYLLLIAMTVTSFMPVRRKMDAKHWRMLHTVGIYFLWGTVWSTYWYELYYYFEYTVLMDYIYYWAGFLVWGLRVCAWGKQRLRLAAR